VIVSPSVRSSRSAASAGSACVPAPHGPAVLSGWRQRHRGSASSRYPGARVRIRTVSLAPAEWTANCTRETRCAPRLSDGQAGHDPQHVAAPIDRHDLPAVHQEHGEQPRIRGHRCRRVPGRGVGFHGHEHPHPDCHVASVPGASPEFRGSPYPPTTRRSSTSAAPAMRLSGLRRSFHARGRRGVRLDQDRGVRVDDSDAVARLPREPS
jgi:hypothetical protein